MAVKQAAPREAAPRIKRSRRPSLDERLDKGRTARDRTPPSSHSGWSLAADRPDPVALLEEQDRTREPDLVPVRHGRMMVSPFTFYRGAAKIMAADLAGTPVADLGAQLCGDAQLSNFGVFASPERRLLFDLNDFDETLPGPFEYDVKRMAASFVIAGRNNGFATADTRAAARTSVTAYREAMAGFAQIPTMDIWYAHMPEDQLREVAKRARKNLAKAHAHDSVQALSKLGELVDGQYRIVSHPPVIVPARDLAATFGLSPGQIMPAVHGLSVKIRVGRALEVKTCHGCPGILDAAGRVRGRMEAWRKWSFPLGPLSLYAAGPPGWTVVHKRRRISRFRLASGQIMAGVPERATGPGCAVELTEVRSGGENGWSLGFEATGPADLLPSTLQSTAALVFAQAPPAEVELGMSHCQSYADWLTRRRVPE